MDLTEHVFVAKTSTRHRNEAPGTAVAPNMSAMPWHTHNAQQILVLGTQPGLPPSLEEVCAALEVETIRAGSHHEMPFLLHQLRPLGVICVMDPIGRDICKVLRSVAAFDQDLPVLIITSDDPACLGIMDAAKELWGLTGLHSIPQPPNPHDIATFVFHAGRQHQSGRLLPV